MVDRKMLTAAKIKGDVRIVVGTQLLGYVALPSFSCLVIDKCGRAFGSTGSIPHLRHIGAPFKSLLSVGVFFFNNFGQETPE